MYIDKINELFYHLKISHPKSVFPCTAQEVNDLEATIGLKLPLAYKEFLLWAGHGAGRLMIGSQFYYDDLLAIQEIAAEMLEEDKSPEILPKDAFVFWMHQGYMFSFFRTSEGDDPPVHHYCEGENEGNFVIAKQKSFTRFLEVEIQDHAQLRGDATEIRERNSRDWQNA